MKKLILIKVFLLFGLLAFSQPVSYDSTFGSNGISTICFAQDGFVNIDMEAQNNGKFISVANGIGSANDIVFGYFSRTNNNGTLDTTFGTNGFYTFSNQTTSVLQTNSIYSLQDIEIQSDNKIVAVGFKQSNTNSFCVARLNSDGGLDTTFNTTGFFEYNFGTIQNFGGCVKIQNDDKIIVGGSSGNNTEFFSMIRLMSNGSLDTGFGVSGKVQTLMSGQCRANSIAIQTDGKILLGGYALNNPNNYDFALVRYMANGHLDTSFGVNGIVTTTINAFYPDVIYKVLVQNNGKIVVVGNEADNTGASRIAAVRYLDNGTIDSAFAINGIYISNNYNFSSDAAIQVDDKIVITGGNKDAGFIKFNVIRLNTDGSIDADFQIGGLILPFENTLSSSKSVVIQTDNKIVCGGSVETTPSTSCSDLSLAMVRLNPGTLSNQTFVNSNVKPYPNPTIGNVFFDNSVNQYENVSVYNYLGQEITEKQLSSTANETIDFSSFSKGVYVLKFKNENSAEVVKVIRE